jgi:hypothetical protein
MSMQATSAEKQEEDSILTNSECRLWNAE